MNNKTDQALISLLSKGDESAFADIFANYASHLTAFAAGKLHDLEAARDIVQEVFINLWNNRSQLQLNHSLKAYLFSLTRYKIINHIRKNIHQEKYAALIESFVTPASSNPQLQLEAKELQQQINLALNELSPRVKEVYVLSREKHLSTKDIADLLHVSEQTVKNQLSTALKHIRTRIPDALAIFLSLYLMK